MTTSPTSALEVAARRLYEDVWNRRDYDVADELFHPDFRTPAAPDLHGGAAKVAAIRGYHATFPDLHVEIDRLVVAAGNVAARLTLSGTDTGGLRGRTATGRRVTTWTAEFLTFDDGRIVEDWVGSDWLGALVQLGHVADPWR